MSFRENRENRLSPGTRAVGVAGGISALRRNTVQLARDAILRRLSRTTDVSSPLRFSFARNRFVTAEELNKLVHEINHMVAAYHQLLHLIGTQNDCSSTREDVSNGRSQCLKTCDTAKNCILPQLKNETQEAYPGSDFTKQANQFIGCVNMFVAEMKRCQKLLRLFPVPFENRISVDETNANEVSPTHSRSAFGDLKLEKELENLSRDLKEAEAILETLENAITVPFPTKEPIGNNIPVVSTPPSRKKGCQCSKLCSSFKTSYA